MLREKEIQGLPGWVMLFLLLALAILSVIMLIRSASGADGWGAVVWVLTLVAASSSLFGLTIVNPNQAKVVQLFGTYKGSLKQQGLRWVHPLSTRRRVSLRVRNFESSKLKVND